eukprot:scaffold1617_cov99-Cylindrotheca_fusiformis.AAC.2
MTDENNRNPWNHGSCNGSIRAHCAAHRNNRTRSMTGHESIAAPAKRAVPVIQCESIRYVATRIEQIKNLNMRGQAPKAVVSIYQLMLSFHFAATVASPIGICPIGRHDH